ncbi:hypothetical protein IQ06DRAFT_141266 [Phaeosphaeriaceae sp. SRC1lsM3a]|nr:hypothetical protein IQ06DRAFT_141266 [Stagonospora sp. SRC1lsM3a]
MIDMWIQRDNVATTVDQATSSVTDPAWSKESLFGLLSVLAVFLLPCLGLLLRLCIARCRVATSAKPCAQESIPQTSIGRKWRKKGPRSHNGRKNTIIVVC